MATTLKRFGAWVTSLRSDLFTWARIKLSALYLLIVAAILLLFSVGIYTGFKDRMKENTRIHRVEEQAAYDQTLDDIQNLVLLADAFILAISAGLSYVLAGYTLKPIKNALEAQSAFAADASHELRTPLAVIRANTEVILRNSAQLPVLAQKLLRTNLEEIAAVSTMAEQLLVLSRGQKISKEAFQKIDFSALLTTVVSKFEHLAANKNIQLSIKKSTAVAVRGNQSSLERMIKNLLANAISYTPKSGSVTVELSTTKDAAQLSISDTGIGISTKDLGHVFERFYKADQARTDTEAGSGLGLSIVKQIVDLHRGSIEIKSTLNKGTTVIVNLPRVF